MRIGIVTLVGMLALAIPIPALGQGNPDLPAPEHSVSINAYGVNFLQGNAPQGLPETGIIRRARNSAEPAELLSTEDPVIRDWLEASPDEDRAFRYIRYRLPVSATGELGECSLLQTSGIDEGELFELCSLVKSRADVLPAINYDGQAFPDELEVDITLRNMPRVSDANLGPIVSSSSERLPDNYPSPPPSGAVWPFNQHYNSWQEPSSYKTRPERGLERPLEPGTEWVGVFVGDASAGQPACSVRGRSSRDEELSSAACTYVTSKLKPKWSRSVSRYNRSYPILLVRSGEGFQAYLPNRESGSDVELADDERARIAALLDQFRIERGAEGSPRLALRIDDAGRASDCEVRTSSLDDALDAYACRLIRDEAQFTPRIDIFGAATKNGYFYWR